MRRTYRYDKDLECVVEVRAGSNYFVEDPPKGPGLISDNMGGVKGLRAMYRKDGKRFDSKSRYRADVKAHGLEIVGNDDPRGSAPPPVDYGRAVKDAYQQFDGNYNGMADRVKAEERQTKWRRDNG
jgi:hypothetical protein